MKNSNTVLLEQMDVKKALIKLSIPAIIGMLVNATYNLVDSIFVGRGAGELAIGGLTLAFPVQMIVVAVALMLGIGGASVFSRAYGVNDKEKMHNTLNTTLRFGVISGIAIMILGFNIITPLLRFFGATDNNIGYAESYLGIILIGITFQTLQMILNNFTRAEGRAKVAMQAMVLGTGLNIILDPIFIFDWGLNMGVEGAATATVISQFIAFLFIGYRTFDKDSILNITFRDFYKLDFKVLWETMKIGFPTFVRNGLGAVLTILILNIISLYASDPELYHSIYGVINRVLMFILMPGFGLVQGLAPIAGFNFGAKLWQRLVDVTLFSTKILFVYFIVGFLLIQFGSTFIFSIFSEETNQDFIEIGSRIFRIIGIGFIFISFQVIASSIYQAFGYAKRALFISLSRQFIFFIPLLFVFTFYFELDGVWYTFFVADILSGIVSLFMLIYEVRVLRHNAKQEISA